MVYVEDGRVVVESRQQLVERTRRDIRVALDRAVEPSIVDELLAERRAEAEAER